MKLTLGLLLGSACVLTPQAVSAQAPYARPAYSPYLNLLRGDSPPVANYYGLVRPELDFRSSVYRLQQQTQANQQAVTDLQTSTVMPPTGTPAGFLNHGSYFQSLTGGAVGTQFGAPMTPGLGVPTGSGAGFGTLGGPSGAPGRPGTGIAQPPSHRR